MNIAEGFQMLITELHAQKKLIKQLQDRVALLEQTNSTSSNSTPSKKTRKRSVLPAENRNATLEVMQPKFKGRDLSNPIAVAKQLAKQHLEEEEIPSHGFFFGGVAGIGKTTIAASLIGIFEKADRNVLFLQPSMLFDMFSRRHDGWKLVEQADLIVLDDFNGSTRGHESSFLEKLIPMVHANGNQLLVVTSNGTYDRFVQGSFPGVVVSRNKDGEVVSESAEGMNDIQRIQRRIGELFEGRVFYYN